MDSFRVCCVLAIHAAMALAQSPDTFTATANMSVERMSHTATLLTNGKVLITGGEALSFNEFGYHSKPWASAELYDPSTGVFTGTGDMTTPRTYHTATLLPDGKVLIVGGLTTSNLNNGSLTGLSASAELYDPATGSFSATGNMTTGRESHTATLLNDGKVLIAGGGGDSSILASAELYDAATGSFSATGNMAADRAVFTATVLSSGKVLIAGGPHQVIPVTRPNAELYDPDTHSFGVLTARYSDLFPVGLASAEAPVTATLLANGKVLLTLSFFDYGGNDAVLYDPAAGSFTRTGNMNNERDYSTGTLLPDGTSLIAGGGSAEVYHPVTGTFSTPMLMQRDELYRATLLPDGTVLLSGGWQFGGCCPIGLNPSRSLSTAELYRPTVLVPAPVLLSLTAEGRGQGAILHGATQQVVSPDNPAVAGEALEIYLTGLIDGSVIPPQVAIGGRAAEVLWFGNAPGFRNLNQVNVRVPNGVAPGSSVPVRLNYLGRPSIEVTLAVQ